MLGFIGFGWFLQFDFPFLSFEDVDSDQTVRAFLEGVAASDGIKVAIGSMSQSLQFDHEKFG